MKKKKKKNGRSDQVCFVEYTRQTNVFNLVKERIYFMSVAGGHSTKKNSKKSFLFMLNNRHVQKEKMIEKKEGWILIHILNCLSNGLSVDTGG